MISFTRFLLFARKNVKIRGQCWGERKKRNDQQRGNLWNSIKDIAGSH